MFSTVLCCTVVSVEDEMIRKRLIIIRTIINSSDKLIQRNLSEDDIFHTLREIKLSQGEVLSSEAAVLLIKPPVKIIFLS